MPNHVRNELIASAEVIGAITRSMTNDEIQELRQSYESQVQRAQEAGRNYVPTEPDYEAKLVDFAMVIPVPSRLYQEGCDGKHPHPHPDGGVYDACWSSWNRDNWGTKWNAYDYEWEDLPDGRVKVTFDTAWSHPDLVVHALSRKFPLETICIRYADEDLGSNCGVYKIQNMVMHDASINPGGDEGCRLACDLLYGVPYEEKRREWDQEEAEWELREAAYRRFQEEAGLGERPLYHRRGTPPGARLSDEEREAVHAAQKAWDEAYKEVMRKGDEYLANLEAAEMQSAIESILATKE